MIAATDFGQVGEMIAVSIGAGVVVSLAFALCLTGAVRAGEARRSGEHAASLAWATLMILSLAAFLGLCVLGIIFITKKQ